MNRVYDVVIIGAGPSGSLLGGLLSRAGMDVKILDAAKEMKRKVCGEYLCPLGVDLLKDLGLNDIIKDFEIIKGMKIFSPSGTQLHCNFPKTSKDNYGVSLNRRIFDQDLLNFAKSCGADISLGTQVSSFTSNGSYWLVKSLENVEFKGRVLIGADGRRSLISKKMGLTLDLATSKIAIHTWIKPKTTLERFGQMHLFDDGSYIGIDPIRDDEVNISLVCSALKIKEIGNVKDVLNHYIEKSIFLKEYIGLVYDDKIYTASPISHKVRTLNNCNIAFVGDAAGFIDPLTGEGIFNAIWMAKNLAEHIIKDSSLFNANTAIYAYNNNKKSFFRQKKVTNYFFQWLIKRRVLLEIIANYLIRKQSRADALVGIIGNVYKPLAGIFKVIF